MSASTTSKRSKSIEPRIPISTRVLKYLTKTMLSKEFKTKFDIYVCNRTDVMEWISLLEDDSSIEIQQLLVKSYEKRMAKNRPLRTDFPNGSPQLKILGTDQYTQYFKVASSVTVHSQVDTRVSEIFDLAISDPSFSPTMIKGSHYLPSITNLSESRFNSGFFSTSIPKAFEVLLYFHALRVYHDFGKEIKRKSKKEQEAADFKCEKKVKNANRIGFAVQKIWKAWGFLAKYLGKKDASFLISPYILFRKDKGIFEVLENREDGFAPLSQSSSLLGSFSASKKEEGCDKTAWNRSSALDKAYRFVSTQLFSHLNSLIGDSQLHDTDEDGGPDNSVLDMFSKYEKTEGKLPKVFRNFPSEVLTAFNISDEAFRDAAQEPEVIDIDVMEDEIQPNPISIRPAKKRRLDSAAMWEAVPKVEDQLVTDSIAVHPGQEIGADDKMAQLRRKITDYMSSHCSVYDVDCEEIIDAHANDSGHYLNDSVQFIITDPPYHTRRPRDNQNSNHDYISLPQMERYVNLIADLLKVGGHGLLFCSDIQFFHWVYYLKNHKTKVDGKEKKTFTIEDTSQKYINKDGHWNQNPGRRGNFHLNVVQVAVHFWKRRPDEEKGEIPIIQYKGQGYVASTLQRRTNCTTNIPRIPPSEKVYNNEKKMLRPEQKLVSLMMEEIATYTKEGDIVVDLFGGTFSTGKACLKLPGMRRYIGCEKDSNCFNLAIPSLLDYFARKCIEDSSMQLESDKLEVAKEYLSLRKVLEAEYQWEPPSGVPQFQCMPEYVVSTLCNSEMAGNLYNFTVKSPVDQWSVLLRNALDAMDVRTSLCMEAGLRKLCLGNSTIKHSSAGLGVFALRDFQENDVITSYYGTLVYEDLSRRKEVTKEYGDGILSVRKDRFQKHALELNGKTRDRAGKKLTVWIVPAPFCVGGKINDPRYLEDDKEYSKRKSADARKANVEFYEKNVSLYTRDDLRKNTLVMIRASRKILRGEELFINYGNVFSYFCGTAEDL